MRKYYTLFSILLLANTCLLAQTMVWSEEFDGNQLDPKVWNIERNIGIWNTGSNQELQHYAADNLTVGDDGQGNNCLIITAQREELNGYKFTSGKVDTRGKFSMHYGTLEARIKLPNLANGLWPAMWLLGYTDKGWPASGEIDLLEAGHGSGITNNKQNTTFSGALHWEHNDAYAGYSKVAEATSNLNDDYHTYKLVWSPTLINMYIDDVTTPYFAMDITGADAEEFRDSPMYLILNLAVGGSFPGITDPNGITAELPAKMYIDYLRVYDSAGVSDYSTSPEQFGPFSVYAEGNASLRLDPIFDAEIVTSNLSSLQGAETKVGNQVLAYSFNQGVPASINVSSKAARNMTRYADNGALEFFIKTNEVADLTLSVTDKNGGHSSVVINAASANNPLRDNTWQKVTIPLSALSGNVNFAAISSLFTLDFTSTVASVVSVDEVKWNEHTASNEYYGIYTENPSITNRFVLNEVTGHLYIWENTLSALSKVPTYDGDQVLAFASKPASAWYGFGLFSDAGVDLTAFADGYLHLAIKSSSTNDFWIGVGGANDTEAKIHFKSANDPYNFKRDGLWHELVIPVSDFTAQGVNLSACGNVFMCGGVSISDIAFDNIVFGNSATLPSNSKLNPNRNDGAGNANAITTDYFGVYSENSTITNHFLIDDVTGHIYTWDNTLTATTTDAYDGKASLSFKSAAVGWYGLGIFTDEELDLTHFANGYLHLAIKTSAADEFWVGVGGASGTEAKITFASGSNPYGFVRDGQWHTVSIPVADLVAKGLKLQACGNIFMFGGSSIAQIAFDDIHYAISSTPKTNPDKNGGDLPLAIETHAQVRIFPNPVVNTLQIEGLLPNSTVQITDLNGKQHQVKQANTDRLQIDISSLSKGLYLLTIKQGSTARSYSIIKQ